VPSDNVKYQGLTFSNDSGYVYYVRYEKSDVGKLYKMTVIGANAIKLLEKVDSPITFSPDGNRFAFVRFDRERGEYSMVVANSDGTNEKVIAKRGSGERLSLGGPAWSPDGKRIVCAASSWSGGYHMMLFEVNLTDGREQLIKCDPWFLVGQVAWQNDRNLIVNASTQPLSPVQIWRLTYPEGKLERITNDLSDYAGISISQDTKTIVTTQNNRQASIWISGPDLAQENRIVTTVGSTYGLAWGAGNRIFFSSMSGTNLDISSIKTDGTDRRQLTFNAGDNYHPAVSSDGRFVVFSSSRAGGFNIWRMDARDGADAKQLTHGGGDFNPSITPDNRFVIYEHQGGGSSTLWRVSIEGGDAIQLVDTYSAVPAVAPDGRYVACRYYIAPDTKGVAVLPVEGGQPVKKFAIPIIDWQRVSWSRESNALSYVDSQGNDYNIWSQPLSDGPPKLLTSFKGEQIFSYDWSPDFRQLVSQRGAEISDVFAIKLAS
jgi:Tol biopolymer transport system component